MQAIGQDRKEIINRVLPQYAKIAESPTEHDLRQRADARNISFEAACAEEQAKMYKAIDNAGNVYLCASPACFTLEIDARQLITKYRPAPRLIYTYAQALDAAENFPTKKNKKDIWGQI